MEAGGASGMSPPPEQKAERLSQDVGKLLISLGFEGSRRNNIVYIEENILMHTCGNTIHFVDVRTMSVTYLPSVGGLGIGAVAIHPSKKKFAVCEKGINPDIYIYDYPALAYKKVLKDGTERLFSAAAFKHDGSQLATVGGYPDYWLTVWDWQNETIILRAKAFSQEVFNVTFSRYFSGQLLTSGVGHIRFWKMASTFTGMKLKGFIGKFGQVPLSDIAGYVELSNGKVLSGTEGGGIIVWEGELVKCQLKRKGGHNCHDGMVEITIHDTAVNELITCGADGYIRFWDFGTLMVEHIVLHAFRTDSHVASFRTEKVPLEMKMIEEVKAIADDKSKSQDKDAASSKEGDAGAADKAQDGEEEDIITKQDLRRLKLKKKFDEYQDYLNTKPDESYANPEDLAAIEYAKNTKGDFKLKTDLTYIPPVEQRTNAVKKRNEMVLLYEAIHNRKMEFNGEFLSLGDKKKQIRIQITQRNARIVEINNLLKIKEEPLYVPETFKDEAPEERNNVTKKDLDDYIERKRKAEAKVEQKDKAGGFGGFGGGPVKKAEKKTEKAEKAAEKTDEAKAKGSPEPQRKMSRKMSERASRKTLREGEISSTTSALRAPSVLEQAEQEAIVLKLKYEKALNKERIDMLIATFDGDLDDIRNQRFMWDIKIKGAELKMLILYQELRLLQILQPKEQALQGRHTAKLLEAEDLLVKISEQEKAVDVKKQEVVVLQERKLQLLAEFEQMMGENNPFRDPLFKIYSKKIKRPKPKAPGEETDSEEESDLEAEGSDEDFEEDEAPEACPPGCEESLYANVLALRERRLDVEEVLVENTKLLESLQREKELKFKKKKGIDIALEAFKREMGEFQKEKQNALNQVDVAITLYMHQVEYIENSAVPADLSAALVFTNASLKQLRATIEGHVAEKAALRRLQKELRKEYSALVRERRAEEENTADTEQRVIDVQMLRFGQVIDLSVVELIRVRRDTLELKERVKEQEMEYSYELGDWSRKLDEATDELARAMRENSASLYTIADLKEKQNVIESSMKVKARAMFRDPLIEKRKDAAEQERLRKIVVKNAEVIDVLESEIHFIHDNIESKFP